jgi:hypothetical protein
MERDWKQHDRHAAYVIAQQYSLIHLPVITLSYREETVGVSL